MTKTRSRSVGWDKIIWIRYLTCKRNITKLINLIWHINIKINIKIILILLNWFYIHKIYFKGVFPNLFFSEFHDFSWYSTRYKNFENSMWSDLEVWKRHTINFIKIWSKLMKIQKIGLFNQKCDFCFDFIVVLRR